MTRNYNIELIRIGAMLMIVAIHATGHGVLELYGTPDIPNYSLWHSSSLINKIFISLTRPGGRVGVGLFFIITGYFAENLRVKSLGKIIIQVFFIHLFLYHVF